MKKVIKYEESSGNVFADLGIENPEEALAKAELARQIAKLIKKKKLKQKQAAEILGIDQPKISALIRGRLRSFSLERLICFLNELGQDVTIMISPAKSASRGHTWMSESHSNTPIVVLEK
ncbi:helix-turn-helix domain-containing protein [Neochlamydia sp. EPS4]|uniref:helix-turn-helix domain-containing protein n=1 Tax=Neochlamydia sp. EPS4 TaxID=1478175 RepID=UPI0005D124EB|nr:helix-turn-helix transcriptional regulator [Neochlamydia sp. EPS4]